MPDADQMLMQRFQAGDESAFEVLVHKYQALVLSLVRRYLGSRYPGVDDVAQQVFVRVFKGRMTYQPRAKVKTWLYSIAVNACLNEIRHLRTEKNRRINSFTAVFGGNDDGGTLEFEDGRAHAADDPYAGDEVKRQVRAAVDQLPDQQRLALVLSRFHHLSYEDIAASMETTIPAVKSLLTRARSNLKKALKELVEGEEPEEASPALLRSPKGGRRG